MTEYQPLSLRLRPQYFKDFVYNEPVILILKNMLLKETVPSSIMFSGTRGIGKTTLARILARAINCTGRGKDFEPCGKCDSCKESTVGSHPDIIEIDGATHSGIDDVRKILDQAMHSPLMSDKKVFIIDEAHNLSRSQASFDALLKILEEPPESVVWIFCTTAKNKFPETIKSRMVALDLRMVPTQVLSDYITKVLAKKDLGFGKIPATEISPVIANLANNSVRDALTLLEKVVPYCGEKGWTRQAVLEATGSFDFVKTSEVMNLISQHNAALLWALFNKIIEEGVEPDVLFDAIAKVINNLIAVYLGNFIEDYALYTPFMEQFPPARILYLGDIIIKRSRDMYTLANKKMILQMLAMELCG